jgi:DNA-binding protein HU-beta
LAEEHQLTKRAGRELLDNLVSLITKHLKKGERIRIAGSASCRLENGLLAWGATLRPARQLSKKVAFRASKELKEAI